MLAFALVPNSNDGSKPVGHAYNRLKFAQIDIVGTANIVPGEAKLAAKNWINSKKKGTVVSHGTE